jgi:hypothetical protein
MAIRAFVGATCELALSGIVSDPLGCQYGCDSRRLHMCTHSANRVTYQLGPPLLAHTTFHRYTTLLTVINTLPWRNPYEHLFNDKAACVLSTSSKLKSCRDFEPTYAETYAENIDSLVHDDETVDSDPLCIDKDSQAQPWQSCMTPR